MTVATRARVARTAWTTAPRISRPFAASVCRRRHRRRTTRRPGPPRRALGEKGRPRPLPRHRPRRRHLRRPPARRPLRSRRRRPAGVTPSASCSAASARPGKAAWPLRPPARRRIPGPGARQARAGMCRTRTSALRAKRRSASTDVARYRSRRQPIRLAPTRLVIGFRGSDSARQALTLQRAGRQAFKWLSEPVPQHFPQHRARPPSPAKSSPDPPKPPFPGKTSTTSGLGRTPKPAEAPW